MAPDRTEFKIEHGKRLSDQLKEAQSELDKVLVSLAGGSLGLSLSFLNNAIPLKTAVWPFAILAAWICWMMSLGLSVSAHVLSVAAIRGTIKRLYNFPDDKKLTHEAVVDPRDKYVGRLNLGAAGTFLVGLMLAITFTFANFNQKERNMSDDTAATGSTQSSSTPEPTPPSTPSAPPIETPAASPAVSSGPDHSQKAQRVMLIPTNPIPAPPDHSHMAQQVAPIMSLEAVQAAPAAPQAAAPASPPIAASAAPSTDTAPAPAAAAPAAAPAVPSAPAAASGDSAGTTAGSAGDSTS